MSDAIFTRPDVWTGGSYELAVEVGPRDDEAVRRALQAIWTAPSLDGCFPLADREPHEQARVAIPECTLDAPLHGVARIGSRPPIACRTLVIRYDDGLDWLHLCLPIGALECVLPVGMFPFDDGGDLAWRPELDEWLCELARRVFQAVPFRLGFVGWEGGEFDDVEAFDASGVPSERWVGYLVASQGRLQWHPPTEGAPLAFGAD